MDLATSQALFWSCLILVAFAGVASSYERESWKHSDGYHRALVAIGQDPNATGVILTTFQIDAWLGLLEPRVLKYELPSPPWTSEALGPIVSDPKYSHFLIYSRVVNEEFVNFLKSFGWGDVTSDLHGVKLFHRKHP